MSSALGALAGAPPAPALRLRGVSKAFGPTRALIDVDLDIAPGTVHGLLGGNGSGKSTLIKVLAGVHTADRGTVEVRGASSSAASTSPQWAAGAGLRFVHQDLGLVADLTVAENLALGRTYEQRRGGRIDWRAVHRRAAAVLERFDVPARPGQLVGEVSQAVRALVAIARALQDEDAGDGHRAVLVLDEPTACLPVAESERLLEALRRYAAAGQTVVLVSHRLPEVVACADAVSVLRDGRHIATVAGPAVTEDALIDLIAGPGAVPNASPRPAVPQGAPAGPPLLQVRGLRSGPVRDVSFDVRAGQIVGIAGMLGSGRSTLLRAVFGAAPRGPREVVIGDLPLPAHDVSAAIAAGVAYVPEDRAHDAAFPDRPLRHNLSIVDLAPYWRGLRLRHRREAADTRRDLDTFLVRAQGDQQLLSALSGGNQQKVVLARWLRTRPRLILLDEPTQGVDVRARSEVHELIRAAARDGAAVVVVSSDFQELAALCDDVHVLRGGVLGACVTGSDLSDSLLTRLAAGGAAESAGRGAPSTSREVLL